jgi:hypothetical protein
MAGLPSLAGVADAMAELRKLREMQLHVFAKHVALEMDAAQLEAPDVGDSEDAFAEHLPRAFAAKEEEVKQLHSAVAELTASMVQSAQAQDAGDSGGGQGAGPGDAAFLVRVPLEPEAAMEPDAAASGHVSGRSVASAAEVFYSPDTRLPYGR